MVKEALIAPVELLIPEPNAGKRSSYGPTIVTLPNHQELGRYVRCDLPP